MQKQSDNKEITGHLMGGIGNLLFILATCYDLSKKYKSTLKFYTKMWNDSKRKNIIKYNMFKNFKLDSNTIRNYKITYRENNFFYDTIHLDSRINNCIYGYFQSYKYFESCKTEFIKMLHNPYSKIIESVIHKYKQNNNNNNNTLTPVSIHVRRTDYLSLSHIHLNLDMKYYLNAISHFSTENSIFILFSDDVEFIQNEPLFKNLPHKIIIDNPDDEYCFWLMSACTHNIIANSSYSWWASYVNSNPDKLVIAPERWFGPSGPQHKIRDIIPDTHNYKLVSIDSTIFASSASCNVLIGSSSFGS
jgi:hypothetical protein